MLNRDECLLLIVDVQERLFPHIDGSEALGESIRRAAKGAAILGLPIVVTEQYTKGLGPTIDLLRKELDSYSPIEKMSFSCMGEPAIVKVLKDLGRRQVLLTGIETHVCVYQTACDLLENGYEVSVVTDCVSSRTASNRELAIHRMERLGASLTSLEMALFELMRVSGTSEFKEISRLIK